MEFFDTIVELPRVLRLRERAALDGVAELLGECRRHTQADVHN